MFFAFPLWTFLCHLTERVYFLFRRPSLARWWLTSLIPALAASTFQEGNPVSVMKRGPSLFHSFSFSPFFFLIFLFFIFAFFCKPILPDFYFLRQGLSVCSPGCPGTHRNPPAFPPRYWIKGMHQHTWLSVCCFVLVTFICVCAWMCPFTLHGATSSIS